MSGPKCGIVEMRAMIVGNINNKCNDLLRIKANINIILEKIRLILKTDYKNVDYIRFEKVFNECLECINKEVRVNISDSIDILSNIDTRLGDVYNSMVAKVNRETFELIKVLENDMGKLKNSLLEYKTIFIDIITSIKANDNVERKGLELIENCSYCIKKIDSVFSKKPGKNIGESVSLFQEYFWALDEINKKYESITKSEGEFIKKIVNTVGTKEDRERNENSIKKVDRTIRFVSQNTSGLVRSEMKQTETRNIDVLYKNFKDLVLAYFNKPIIKSINDVEKLVEVIDALYSNSNLDKEYAYSEIEMRIKSFLSIKSKYDDEKNIAIENERHFVEKYQYYLLLCEKAGQTTISYIYNDTIQTFSQVEELNMKIIGLENLLMKKAESDYILGCVDNVLINLGYDLVATGTIVNPKRSVEHHIYDFGTNAINVYISDNNNIMFEISGVDDKDREPTPSEKVKIKEDMEKFCSVYEDIKRELASDRIFVKQESLCAADEKYAKIINIKNKNSNIQRNKNSSKSKRTNRKKAMEIN